MAEAQAFFLPNLLKIDETFKPVHAKPSSAKSTASEDAKSKIDKEYLKMKDLENVQSRLTNSGVTLSSMKGFHRINTSENFNTSNETGANENFVLPLEEVIEARNSMNNNSF